MKTDILPATSAFLSGTEKQQFALDILQGLGKKQKRLSSKYFYDATGSKLFRQIMQLPEYYLTRVETEIFTNQQHQIIRQFPQNTAFNLVDLGAGDAAKTKILLRILRQNQTPFTYIPIDISADALHGLEKSLDMELPDVPVKPLAGDYFKSLAQLQQSSDLPKVILFLGSNIGNFPYDEIKVFLQKLRQYLQTGDQILIGFDLKKDPHLIRQAYDDAAGITTAFNFNLLHRINQTFGGNFNPANFKHFAEYNPVSGEMKSYLISTQIQEVTLLDLDTSFHFQAWETIQTESSYKFSEEEIRYLALGAGLHVRLVFTDANRYFADVLFDI